MDPTAIASPRLHLLATSPKSFRKCLALCLVAAACAPSLAAEAPPRSGREAAAAKAFGLLTTAMRNDDRDVRALAARQWGRIGNAAALDMLSKALKDDSPFVRLAAAKSLQALGDASGVGPVEEIVGHAPKLPEKGKKLSDAEMMLFAAINKVRAEAVRVLAEISRSTSSKEVLRKALADADGRVRDASAVALARLGDGTGLDDFAEALGSEDPAIRVQAAQALGDSGLPAYAERVGALADDTEWQVRCEAMSALGRLGGEGALPGLRKGLEDQNELVRSKAVEALGAVGSKDALPWLRDARSKAGNVYVELQAIAAMIRVGERTQTDASVAQRALSQRDADTRMLGVEVLEELGGDAAMENLETELGDEDSRVRVRAAAALLRLFRDGGKNGEKNAPGKK
jgi:HEAT repeat protein